MELIEAYPINSYLIILEAFGYYSQLLNIQTLDDIVTYVISINNLVYRFYPFYWLKPYGLLVTFLHVLLSYSVPLASTNSWVSLWSLGTVTTV